MHHLRNSSVAVALACILSSTYATQANADSYNLDAKADLTTLPGSNLSVSNRATPTLPTSTLLASTLAYDTINGRNADPDNARDTNNAQDSHEDEVYSGRQGNFDVSVVVDSKGQHKYSPEQEAQRQSELQQRHAQERATAEALANPRSASQYVQSKVKNNADKLSAQDSNVPATNVSGTGAPAHQGSQSFQVTPDEMTTQPTSSAKSDSSYTLPVLEQAQSRQNQGQGQAYDHTQASPQVQASSGQAPTPAPGQASGATSANSTSATNTPTAQDDLWADRLDPSQPIDMALSEQTLQLNILNSQTAPAPYTQLVIDLEHPNKLKESFILAGDKYVLSYSETSGAFAITYTLKALTPEQAQDFQVPEQFKNALTQRFHDKEKLLYGEYTVINELNFPTHKELTLKGFLKKPEDGILPDMQNYLYERTVLDKGYIATISCEFRGSQAQAALTSMRFEALEQLCKRIVDGYRYEFKTAATTN